MRPITALLTPWLTVDSKPSSSMRWRTAAICSGVASGRIITIMSLYLSFLCIVAALRLRCVRLPYMHNVFDNWFRGGCRSSVSMLPPTPFYKRKSRKSFTFCYRRRVSSALVLSAGTKQICLSRTLRLNKQIIIVESCDYHTISFVALPSVQGTPQILRHDNRRPMSVSNNWLNSHRFIASSDASALKWGDTRPKKRATLPLGTPSRQ